MRLLCAYVGHLQRVRKWIALMASAFAASTIVVAVSRAGAEESTAGKGAEAFALTCAMCHATNLEGAAGPALRGNAFMAKWKDAGVAGLAAYIHAAMPPGTNKPTDLETAKQLAAYIFAVNASTSPQSASRGDAIAQAETERRRKVAAAFSPINDVVLQNPPSGDWLLWRRDAGTQGFSPLRQIDATNVGSLRMVWNRPLGKGTNGIAPLVHDGVMFVHGGGRIAAFEAATGALLWAKDAPTSRTDISQPRGLALYGTSVIASTIDRKVMALDGRTGAVLWETTIDGPGVLTAAPLVAGGRVFQGSSQCAFAGQRCRMTALDAATGKVLWTFMTVPGDKDPGSESWGGALADERGGAGVWAGPTYDFKNGRLLFGTGNTYAVDMLLRKNPLKPADGLYINSTLDLDAATGKLIWHFQHLAGDVWDLDAPFERIVMTDPRGSGRKIVVTIGKIGIIDALDLETGRFLWSIDLGEQNIVTRIDPRTGRKFFDPGRIPTQDRGVMTCPYAEGVRNWQAISYDPERELLFVPMTINTCMETKVVHGQRFGSTWQLKTREGGSGRFGASTSIDLKTGKPVWREERRAPPTSAQLATAGGIVFEGSADREFHARRSTTGEVLWRTRLGATPTSFPITFTADGKQYVAVVAGGGTYHDGVTTMLTPEIDASPAQPTLWVFALP